MFKTQKEEFTMLTWPLNTRDFSQACVGLSVIKKTSCGIQRIGFCLLMTGLGKAVEAEFGGNSCGS